MAWKGGVQPGAGRPKGSLNKLTISRLEMKHAVHEYVKENINEILGALFERTKGIKVIKPSKNGEGIDEAFTLPPDSSSARLLLEHALGKPDQSVDLTSDNEKIEGVLYYPKKEDVE